MFEFLLTENAAIFTEVAFAAILSFVLWHSRFNLAAVVLAAEWFLSYGLALLWVEFNPDSGFEYVIQANMVINVLAFAAFAIMHSVKSHYNKGYFCLAALELAAANVLSYAIINDDYYYSPTFDYTILSIQTLMIISLIGTIYGGAIIHTCRDLASLLSRKLSVSKHKN